MNIITRHGLSGLATAAALLWGAAFTQTTYALSYVVTDLGDGQALGINNLGQVVGATSGGRAFLYSGGATTDLGTLAGAPSSTARDINSSGQITGYSGNPGFTNSVFLYSGGDMSNLGTLGGSQGFGLAINDAGQVVGNAQTASGSSHAFLYSGGTMNDLGTLGGTNSIAWDINNSGVAAGWSDTANGNDHAFIYSAGNMVDLGVLAGGRESEALGINNLGQVAGTVWYDDGPSHVFLYSDGTMNDLGGLDITAWDINNSGQIVGNGSEGYLYSDNQWLSLNSLINAGWFIDAVFAINDSGEIAAMGHSPTGGGSRALLLTPGTVPEPGTGMLVWLSLGTLAAWRRRGRVSRE